MPTDCPDPWTYEVSPRGFKLFYLGELQAGALLPDDMPSPTGAEACYLVETYTAYCRNECEWRNRTGFAPLERPSASKA